MAVIQILCKYFLYWELFTSNTIKNRQGRNSKNLLGINLVFIQIPGTYKIYLDHTGTPAKKCSK